MALSMLDGGSIRMIPNRQTALKEFLRLLPHMYGHQTWRIPGIQNSFGLRQWGLPWCPLMPAGVGIADGVVDALSARQGLHRRTGEW